MKYTGELAALGTATFFAIGTNLFTGAARRMGSVVLNRLRTAIGLVLLSTTLWLVHGAPWPVWATPAQVTLLALSGLVGFAFGDGWGFRSMVVLGAGRAALLSSTAPLFTVAIAWPVLGERPGPLTLLGMALTLGGIAIVLSQRDRVSGADAPAPPNPPDPALAAAPARVGHGEGSVIMGIVAGLLAGLGQAGGSVLSKLALRTGIDALSATVIRLGAAVIAIWGMAFLARDVRRSLAPLADRRTTALITGGSACGPLLGVTLSLVSLQYIPAGVAASITAFYPVLAILIASRFHGERLTPAILLGTLIAVAGVVVLFLR